MTAERVLYRENFSSYDYGVKVYLVISTSSLSGSYNMTYLTLEWENDYPVHCRDQLTLTEFSLVGEPIATEGHDNFDFDKDASGDFRKLIFSPLLKKS